MVNFYEELSPRHDINDNNKNERPIMELPGQGLFHFILILILISDTIFRQLAENKELGGRQKSSRSLLSLGSGESFTLGPVRSH